VRLGELPVAGLGPAAQALDQDHVAAQGPLQGAAADDVLGLFARAGPQQGVAVLQDLHEPDAPGRLFGGVPDALDLYGAPAGLEPAQGGLDV
jgi:hypothetical protein